MGKKTKINKPELTKLGRHILTVAEKAKTGIITMDQIIDLSFGWTPQEIFQGIDEAWYKVRTNKTPIKFDYKCDELLKIVKSDLSLDQKMASTVSVFTKHIESLDPKAREAFNARSIQKVQEAVKKAGEKAKAAAKIIRGEKTLETSGFPFKSKPINGPQIVTAPRSYATHGFPFKDIPQVMDGTIGPVKAETPIVQKLKGSGFDELENKTKKLVSKASKLYQKTPGIVKLGIGIAAGAVALKYANENIFSRFNAHKKYLPNEYADSYDLIKEQFTDFGSPLHMEKLFKVLMPRPSSTRNCLVTNVNSIVKKNDALFLHRNAIGHTRFN